MAGQGGGRVGQKGGSFFGTLEENSFYNITFVIHRSAQPTYSHLANADRFRAINAFLIWLNEVILLSTIQLIVRS